MNKTKLIDAMAEKSGLTKKDAEKALAAFIETIQEGLAAGEKIQITGFGTFEISERDERKVSNPQTGEEIDVPALRAPKFKAGKELKEAVKA